MEFLQLSVKDSQEVWKEEAGLRATPRSDSVFCVVFVIDGGGSLVWETNHEEN